MICHMVKSIAYWISLFNDKEKKTKMVVKRQRIKTEKERKKGEKGNFTKDIYVKELKTRL